MKSIIEKRIIPARTQSQEENFSSQSIMWSTKVRSGHNICCCALSFQAVELLSKTDINHWGFFASSLR